MNDVSDAVVLRTEHLGRRVGEQWIVNDVSLSVNRGELLGLVGASGSGKSSLLRLLNRLDEPTSGTVFLEGQDYREIPPRTLRQRLGMVTQRPFLFPETLPPICASGRHNAARRLPAPRLPSSWSMSG